MSDENGSLVPEERPAREPNGREPNGREPNGRFVPGHRLGIGGRPRRPDLFCIARELADAEGYDLKNALWKVTRTMIDRALAGDVQAARLLYDRLTDSDPLEVNITAQTLSEHERAERLEQILRAAAARRKAGLDEPS